MKTFLVARRELAAYLRNPTGYAIAAAVLLIDGLLFNAFALGGKDKLSSDVLGLFFYFSSGTTIVSGALLSMRLFAEERQTGSLVLLTTSPVRERDLVLGKWLSALAFLMLMTVATGFMPALIFVHGKVSLGHVLVGYLGLLLLGAATTAIGVLGSAMARSQILAGIFSSAVLVVLILAWLLGRATEPPFSGIFEALAFYNTNFEPFQKGVLHLRGVVYYIAVSYVALVLATLALQARRSR